MREREKPVLEQVAFLLTREYFGSAPSGGFRYRCRQCMAQRQREYYRENPEQQQKRNARRQQRGGHIRANDGLKRKLLQMQRGICLCCGEPIADIDIAEVDHATPLAKGGRHDESNLLLARKMPGDSASEASANPAAEDQKSESTASQTVEPNARQRRGRARQTQRSLLDWFRLRR